jgi:hypothetical protein
MNENNLKYLGEIINESYATLGINSIQKRNKMIK